MKTKKGFTLIEMIIAITIVVIISIASYAPYNYYKNKAKLKNSASEISQILSYSRNMAINWMVWTDWNVSIWVFFDTANKNEVNIYSYPHDINQDDISYLENDDIKKIDTIYLDKWIEINDIEGKSNILFFFDAISWNLKYYTWNAWVRSEVVDSELQLHISYKWSSSPNLNKYISYFTSTNIIDY